MSARGKQEVNRSKNNYKKNSINGYNFYNIVVMNIIVNI